MNILEITKKLQPKKKVLIIGAAFIDVIVHAPNLPKPGGDVTVDFYGNSVGGCAFNVADVLHKLKLPLEVFIPVGSGPYSKLVKEAMHKYGYNIYIEIKDQDNGWCLSMVEPSGERTFITIPGIETKMRKEWFEKINIADFDYFYLSGYELEGQNGEVLVNVLSKKKPTALIIFDSGPRGCYIDKDILKKAYSLGTIASLNNEEILELTQEKDIEQAAKTIYKVTNQPVIVTTGSDGAMIYDGKKIINIPGFTSQVVDTIGAGDAHVGGIIAGLMCDISLEEAVYLANKVSAVVVSRSGAATAPTLAELVK